MAGEEPLGNVVLKLGLDNSKFGSELQRSKQEVKFATAEMKANMLGMGAAGSVFDKLSAKQKGLTNVMEAQRKEVQALQKSYEQSFTKDGNASRNTAKLATQLENAKAKLGALNKEFVQNAIDTAKAKVANEGFTGQLNKASKAMISIGSGMNKAGSTMTRNVTTPIVAGLGTAVKLAIDFDSQIAQMGPLLTNGGKVTAAFQQQLDRLGESSKKWASQYGISTTEINNGMSELIKRGFTAQQVMGSMPSVLDATVASGEDMGTVMQATASIMEQFGLKGKTTAETMKNTQRVTDSLTYAANATAAGFGDMSEAMSYAGPQAAALGLSVEQTAAAIGMLSNQGIEGQKAGTNLRGMLTSLVKPTKQQTAAFNEMGISSQELARDSHDLPALIRDLEQGTKGLTKAEKARLIAQAFGKQNQSAVNALIKGGSKELAKLTKETENADGATKKIAKTMSETQANQIKRTIESIKQMGITIGQQVLPLIPPLLKDINGLVKSFNKLDDGTKQNIVKWIALTAAIGPFLKVGGTAIGTIGKLGKGFIDFKKAIAGWQAANAAKASLQGVADVAGKVTSKTTEMGGATGLASKLLGKFGGSAAAAGASSTGFLGTIAPLAPAIAGVGLAVGAGVAAWKLWGEAAWNNYSETQRWGTGVGAEADRALNKFQGFQQGADVALGGLTKSANDNAKGISSAFNGMAKSISQTGSKTKEELKNAMSGLPKVVRDVLSDQVKEQEKSVSQAVKTAKQTADNISNITKNASKEHRNLTDEENQYILNSQRTMNEAEVNALNVSSSKKKLILRTLNGDIGKLNQTQIRESLDAVTVGVKSELKVYRDQRQKIKDLYKSGAIDSGAMNEAMDALDANYAKNTDSMIANAFKLMKAQGMTKDQMVLALGQLGVSYDEALNIAAKASQGVSTSLSLVADTAGKMSKKSREAGDTWNSIVLDPKTGEVKTNLQDVINDTANSQEGWSKLLFAAKNAKIDSNAKAMIGEAAIANGTWDSLDWKTRKMLVASNVDGEVAQALTKNGEWNKLTFEQKTAIISAKGTKQLTDVLFKAGVWNSLTFKEQQATVKDKGTSALMNVLNKAGVWQGLSLKEQQAIVQTKGASALADMVAKYGGWNDLPEKVKNMLVNDDDARKKLTDAGVLADIYNGKKLNTKHMTADESDFAAKAAKVAKLTTDYNVMKVNGKRFMGDPTSIVNASNKGTDAINNVNKKPIIKKGFTGDPKNVMGASSQAVGSISKFNGKNPGLKKFTGKDNATGPANSATRAVKGFGGNQTITKTFKVVSSFVGNAANAIKKVFGFKNGTSYFSGAGMAMVNDQLGGTFRELVQLPTGEAFIPQGRNVILPSLPTGSKVVPANMTKQLFPGIKQYANGKNIPANADVVTITNSLTNNLTKQTTAKNEDGELKKMFGEMLKMMDQINKNILKTDEISTSGQLAPQVLQIDGKTIGQVITPYVDAAMNKTLGTNNLALGRN